MIQNRNSFKHPGKLWAIITTLLLLIVVLFNFPVEFTYTASAADPGSADSNDLVTILHSKGVDENDDKTFDTLELAIQLNIVISGEYHIYGKILESGIQTREEPKQDLEVGVHEIFLSFSGAEIFKSARDGPYSIEVLVFYDSGDFAKVTHDTEAFNYESFNPTPSAEHTGLESITVVNNTIKLETNTFIAVIYELAPMIVFYYTSDDGQSAKFKITYENIIGFLDSNSDGKYQSNELKYWGNLMTSHWNSPKTLMDNFNNFDFQVQTFVDMINENNEPLNTKIELVFHYSSLTKATDMKAARKFDISLRVLGTPLNGITHLSLEHKLEDTMGNHEFKDNPGATDNKISFMTIDEKERGYYSWKNFVEHTKSTGPKTNDAVTHNLVSTGTDAVKKLYINYPYSADTSNYFHDPEVGVVPENAPSLPVPKVPDIISHNQWLIIYIVVIIIASAVMVGNLVHWRRKKRL